MVRQDQEEQVVNLKRERAFQVVERHFGHGSLGDQTGVTNGMYAHLEMLDSILLNQSIFEKRIKVSNRSLLHDCRVDERLVAFEEQKRAIDYLNEYGAPPTPVWLIWTFMITIMQCIWNIIVPVAWKPSESSDAQLAFFNHGSNSTLCFCIRDGRSLDSNRFAANLVPRRLLYKSRGVSRIRKVHSLLARWSLSRALIGHCTLRDARTHLVFRMDYDCVVVHACHVSLGTGRNGSRILHVHCRADAACARI